MRWAPRLLVAAAAVCAASLGLGVVGSPPAWAGDVTVQDAREAYRLRDKARLTGLRDALLAERHPLAPWADFWLMQLRLSEASVAEVDDFLNRWGDAYVADRLRNDWLLELGRRKDWASLVRVQSGFRMNDDREVTCLGVLARQ
ncbi:MAG TPA: lytic transglycosylase domain-containing protein, partial [Aquabacterium sp.]|nr:lytic transglycosylase domain-containing protein [Aquabacterium sp.]